VGIDGEMISELGGRESLRKKRRKEADRRGGKKQKFN
jgi:hypothetical protein